MTLGLATMPRMAGKKEEGKKPASGGKNKTPRKPIQMPTDWLKVARIRAGTKQQPTLWYLIALIAEDARTAGVTDLPPLPWEREDEKTGRG